ncbi:MAG: hypothetical protein ACLQVX_00025 [Limisphaerales bacterium]
MKVDGLIPYINVKLSLLGLPQVPAGDGTGLGDIVSSLIAQYREKERLLSNYLCPADQRIQTFLYDYLQDAPSAKLPLRTFVLDRPGLARALSLPVDRDEFVSGIVSSYRVKQGVLHNPRSDRRTTTGIFHVAEGGLPIPEDKIGVPKAVFARMLNLAFAPPREDLCLPFTATQPKPAECFVSLLIRPLVSPEVPGFSPSKTMEIRFFAPGNLVSNLDFVESIFGNAGDPALPENDAGLDTEHWSGNTGCVILAPHLTKIAKKSIGLPPWDQATARQRRDGMCWKDEGELYNNGEAFKLTCRDESGVIVTLIADNYFGYCKKEIKTQISYAANLFGLCEEEHAGGALVFPSYDLGEEFSGDVHVKSLGHSFAEVTSVYREVMDVRPSGYKVRMERPKDNRSWRLVGTVGEGTLFHKPCTVSGGGKSEISKPITDAVLTGPVFVADFKKDFDQVAELIARDYSGRFKNPARVDRRSILSPERSLGSVIKLLTPDERDYRPEYNAWLGTVPQYLKELVFVLKRFYKPAWGNDWRGHFSVDIINGRPANELKCDDRKLVAAHLRVGFDADGSWRTFGLRKDYYPAVKIQFEDDITVSVVVPPGRLNNLPGDTTDAGAKFVANCELRLFQRPDDAIHRGYDQQTESDFAAGDNFFSNYEPLRSSFARELIQDSIGFYQFSEPARRLIRQVAAEPRDAYFVSSAYPRMVGGRPSKNPRYLQKRPDLVHHQETYLSATAARLRRRLPLNQPVYNPVAAILPGRRNNPPEGGIRPLAVHNPIHYFELPELFMEFICSMTGKSPSTTGAGSEGALTKGPFNALPPIIDLNNALVSWVLTGHNGFVTATGWIGPKTRVDHDISLLVPEIWCRMSPEEREPKFLIANDYLEKCRDFEHGGRRVLASRLGYRINARFVRAFFGRVFNHPSALFAEEMLRPELQDMEIFVDGMDNIVETQRRVAKMYFDDGSIEQACPPLRALLHIMLHDQWEAKGLEHPDFRRLFRREELLASDWYAARLAAKQRIDRRLWQRHLEYLDRFLKKTSHADEAARLGIADRLTHARAALKRAEAPAYLEELRGTLGAEPIENYLPHPPGHPEHHTSRPPASVFTNV